jgi:hypothetical protein
MGGMTGSDAELAFILLALVIVIPYGLWAVYKGITMSMRRRKDNSPKRY